MNFASQVCLSDRNSTAARRCYHIALGTPKDEAYSIQPKMLVSDLEELLTRLTGGITFFMSHGTWTQNAQNDDFSGAIEHDFVVNILVTMPIGDHDTVWPKIVQSVRASVLLHGLPIQFVHVMAWEVQSLIFQIREDEIPHDRMIGGAA